LNSTHLQLQRTLAGVAHLRQQRQLPLLCTGSFWSIHCALKQRPAALALALGSRSDWQGRKDPPLCQWGGRPAAGDPNVNKNS